MTEIEVAKAKLLGWYGFPGMKTRENKNAPWRELKLWRLTRNSAGRAAQRRYDDFKSLNSEQVREYPNKEPWVDPVRTDAPLMPTNPKDPGTELRRKDGY